MHKFSKRTLAIVVPVAALSVAGIAYAASLTVTSTTLGGGNDSVTNTCAIDVSYDIDDLAYDNAASAYVLSTVNVRPAVAANCADNSWRVTVTNAAGDSLAEAKGTFNPAGDDEDGALLTPTTGAPTAATADAIANVYATATETSGDV